MKTPGAFTTILLILTLSCTRDELPAPADSRCIVLRWVPAYETENWQQVKAGMRWSFSFLGATLPPGSMQRAISRIDEQSFELALEPLGFTEPALQALEVIIGRLKTSEEYQAQGAVSLGRFLVLTLHSSWHYYEITGVPKTLEGFLARQNPDNGGLAFPVLESTVSNEHRMIRFTVSPHAERLAFLAEESPEDISRPGFHIGAYEAFDIMPNGQLRFAIYDAEGKLAPAASLSTSRAGKPSKCLWCHETRALSLFAPSPEVEGFMSSERFSLLIDSANQVLNAYRSMLSSDLDFEKQPEHTQSELLYISFMEPSAQHVAREWGWPLEEVELLLSGNSTHTFPEFPFLGQLHHRRLIDSLAPYGTEAVPGSVREPNGAEPNYFN